jgi:hypothetical protein
MVFLTQATEFNTIKVDTEQQGGLTVIVDVKKLENALENITPESPALPSDKI